MIGLIHGPEYGLYLLEEHPIIHIWAYVIMEVCIARCLEAS
jgi:hypothetical protein